MCSQNLKTSVPKSSQLALELVDLAVGAHPLGLGRKALHALDQHAPVPRAVEQRNLPGFGQAAPEAVQVVALFVVAGGRGDGMDHVAARVDAAR